MKKIYFILLLVVINLNCQMAPPEKMLNDFEKTEIIEKQQDLQYYLAENVNSLLTGESSEPIISEIYTFIVGDEEENFVQYKNSRIKLNNPNLTLGQKVRIKITGYDEKEKYYTCKILKIFPNKHEIFITDQLFGNSYGIINNKNVYVKGADLGDKLIVELTSTVKSSGNFYAKIIKHIANVSTKIEGQIRIDENYNLVIINKNKKRGYYGLINNKKVVVIGASEIGQECKVKILDKEDDFYYSQIVYE